MAAPTFSQDCEVLTTVLYEDLRPDHARFSVKARLSALVGLNQTVLPRVEYVDTVTGESVGNRTLHGHVEAFADMLGLLDGPDINDIAVRAIFGALTARIYQSDSDMYAKAIDDGIYGRGYVMRSAEVQA